jgi:hypothetical protein
VSGNCGSWIGPGRGSSCGAPRSPQSLGWSLRCPRRTMGFLVLTMLSVSGGQLTSDLPAVIERPEVIRLKQLGVSRWKQLSGPGGRRRLLLGFGSPGYGVAGR